jgi:hypothetical protein
LDLIGEAADALGVLDQLDANIVMPTFHWIFLGDREA